MMVSAIPLQDDLYKLLKQYAVSFDKEVILASGQKSNLYIDCRQLYFRAQAQLVLGELFFSKLLFIEKGQEQVSACGGMAMGSIPLSIALSTAALKRGRDLPGFAVRKAEKEHGQKNLIEGSSCLK